MAYIVGMDTKKVAAFFGGKASAMSRLGVYRQKWDYWEGNGIPYIWQIAIKNASGGKLIPKHKPKVSK